MYKTFFNNVGIIDLGSGKIKAGTSNSEEPTVYDSLIGRPKYQKVTTASRISRKGTIAPLQSLGGCPCHSVPLLTFRSFPSATRNPVCFPPVNLFEASIDWNDQLKGEFFKTLQTRKSSSKSCSTIWRWSTQRKCPFSSANPPSLPNPKNGNYVLCCLKTTISLQYSSEPRGYCLCMPLESKTGWWWRVERG